MSVTDWTDEPIDAQAAALRASAERLREQLRACKGDAWCIQRIADECYSPVLIATNTGALIYGNLAVQRLTGFDSSTFREMTIVHLKPPGAEAAGARRWREFVVRGRQEGVSALRRLRGDPRALRYCSLASVLPGVHITVLEARKRLRAPAPAHNV